MLWALVEEEIDNYTRPYPLRPTKNRDLWRYHQPLPELSAKKILGHLGPFGVNCQLKKVFNPSPAVPVLGICSNALWNHSQDPFDFSFYGLILLMRFAFISSSFHYVLYVLIPEKSFPAHLANFPHAESFSGRCDNPTGILLPPASTQQLFQKFVMANASENEWQVNCAECS